MVDDQYDAAGTYTAAENVVQRALDAARASAPSGNSTAPAPWSSSGRRRHDPVDPPPVTTSRTSSSGPRQAPGRRPGRLPGRGSTDLRPGTRINGLGSSADNLNGAQWIAPSELRARPGHRSRRRTSPSWATAIHQRWPFDTAGSTGERRRLDGVTITGGDEGAPAANSTRQRRQHDPGRRHRVPLSSQGGGVYLHSVAPTTSRSRTTTSTATAARTLGRSGSARPTPRQATNVLEAPRRHGAEHEHLDPPQPDHEQRRHQPRRRHRDLRRLQTATRSTTTTSAATSPPSTAAASAHYGRSDRGRITSTASTSTSPTTRAAA